MSLPRFCRVPLACSLALALVSLGAAAKDDAGGNLALPLCGAEAKTSEYQDLALYATAAGLALGELSIEQMVDALTGAKSTSACAKATAANLAVAFPGQPAVLLSGPVTVGAGGTSIGVVDPVLCTSYTTTGLTINLGDTNGGNHALAGWESIRYDLGTRRFMPVAAQGENGALVQCHTFPWNQTVSNPPQYGAAGASTRIFRSSFDRSGDLLVEMIDPVSDNRIGELEITEGQPFSYTMRVSNIGETTVDGVRIREFVPSQTLTPLVQTGSWTCVRENQTACGSSTTAGIALDGLSIAPGQTLTFEINRAFAAPAPVPGSLSMVAAAAFVDPGHATGGGEKNLLDNAQALVLSVVANKAPVVSCAPSSVTFVEDAAAQVVTCSATDADGDLINPALAVTNAATGSPTDFGPVTVAVAAGNAADSWELTITPKAEQAGTLTVHAKATDILGAVGTPFALPVSVNAANDVPTFTTHSTTVVLSPTGLSPTDASGGSLDDGSVHLVSRGSDCGNSTSDGCTISISNFFSAIDPGAANEASQVVAPNTFSCVTQSGTSVTNAFYTRPNATTVANNAAGISWIYSKAAAADTVITCEVTFSDNGTPVATSLPTTITFSMAAPAP